MYTTTFSVSAFFQRLCALTLAVFIVLVNVFTVNIPTAQAATTWTVTTTTDDAAGGTCTAIACTLRDALNSAYFGDVIQFQKGLTGTIKLGNAGTLYVKTSVTINGPGATKMAIDGDNKVGVLIINSDIDVSVDGLTIQHSGGGATGGINISSLGRLTISNSIISDNLTKGSGGGIYNRGELTVNDSTVSNNFSTIGGGIYNDGTLTINSSSFYSNFATFAGGIENSNMLGGGKLIVNSSTFSDNLASVAGSIDNDGTLTVKNSSFTSNSARDAGGIFNRGVLTITNSTIAGNTASSKGGGIFNNNSLNLLSNIIATNVSVNGGQDIYNNSGAVVTSLGYNLIGNGTGSYIIPVVGDQIGTITTPQIIVRNLAALADNGGPTQTIAFPSTNLAYKKGYCGGNSTVTPPIPAVKTDQRGQPRKGATTGCDVGAFELQPSETKAVVTAIPTDTAIPPISMATPLRTPGPLPLVSKNYLNDTSLITGQSASGLPCIAPCFQDIIVGKTAFTDAVAMIKGNTLFRGIETQNAFFNNPASATWNTASGEPCCEMTADTNGVVNAILIKFAPNMTAGQLIAKFGKPKYVSGTDYSATEVAIALMFPEVGLIAWVSPGDANSTLNTADPLVVVTFLDPSKFGDLLKTATLQGWNGYLSYHVYQSATPIITPQVTPTPQGQ